VKFADWVYRQRDKTVAVHDFLVDSVVFRHQDMDLLRVVFFIILGGIVQTRILGGMRCVVECYGLSVSSRI
jgi:hypothetical protein